jgi:hypothetical protein
LPERSENQACRIESLVCATTPISVDSHTQLSSIRAMNQLVDEAETLVKQRMTVYDSSHDWHHVHRVRKQGCAEFASFNP